MNLNPYVPPGMAVPCVANARDGLNFIRDDMLYAWNAERLLVATAARTYGTDSWVILDNRVNDSREVEGEPAARTVLQRIAEGSTLDG